MSTQSKEKRPKFSTGLGLGLLVASAAIIGVTQLHTVDAHEPDAQASINQAIANERAADYGRQIDSFLRKTGADPEKVNLDLLASGMHAVGTESHIANTSNAPGAIKPLSYKAGGLGFCVEYKHQGATGTFNDCGAIGEVTKPQIVAENVSLGVTGTVSGTLMMADGLPVVVDQSMSVEPKGKWKATYTLAPVTFETVLEITVTTATGKHSVVAKDGIAILTETGKTRGGVTPSLGIKELHLATK